MLNYVNGFSCATDVEQGEFIFNFVQRMPKCEDGNMQSEMDTEIVSSLIMPRNTAENLLEALNSLLNNENK